MTQAEPRVMGENVIYRCFICDHRSSDNEDMEEHLYRQHHFVVGQDEPYERCRQLGHLHPLNLSCPRCGTYVGDEEA